jgi:hypothetical protein
MAARTKLTFEVLIVTGERKNSLVRSLFKQAKRGGATMTPKRLPGYWHSRIVATNVVIEGPTRVIEALDKALDTVMDSR